MSVKAFITVVGAAVAFAGVAARAPRDVGTEKPTDRAATTAERDNAVSIKDLPLADFQAMCGPYDDPSLQVNMVVTLNPQFPQTRVTVESGPGSYFAYFAGKFSRFAPEREANHNMFPIWPIVTTGRVKTGAEGTFFLIHFDAASNTYTLVRLRQWEPTMNGGAGGWGGGPVKFDVFGATDPNKTRTIPNNQGEDLFYRVTVTVNPDNSVSAVWNGSTTQPVALADDPAAQAIVANIKARAPNKGVPLPTEQPQPLPGR